MTVFKAFLKVLNKNKISVIVFTVILLVFAGFNMKTSDNSTNFVASKPDVLIINNDENVGITKSLTEYIEKNSNVINIEDNEEAISDALFYRDVNYIIYIPENYRMDFLSGRNPEIQVKSTGDYQAFFEEMLLERYIKIANAYRENISDENDLINKINEVISNETEIEVTSKLDTDNIQRASYYYTFANYSILAGCTFVICLILTSFREEKIFKRTIVSSMNYKKHNMQLLISNTLFAIVLWLFYVLISFVLIGKIMFSIQGLIFIINSLVFTLCAVTIAFLIANLVSNKNAINGIVNVVALGSSFLCGAFVPTEYLPDYVSKIAHILPSYYYIDTNNLITKLENINFKALEPVLFNMGMLILFSVVFIIFTNVVSKKNRKIA